MAAALPSWAAVLQSGATAPASGLLGKNPPFNDGTPNERASPLRQSTPRTHPPPIHRQSHLSRAFPRPEASASPSGRTKPQYTQYGRRNPLKTTCLPPRRRHSPVSFGTPHKLFSCPPHQRPASSSSQPLAAHRSTAAAVAPHGARHGAPPATRLAVPHAVSTGANHHSLLQESAFRLALRSFPPEASSPSSSPTLSAASPLQPASLSSPRNTSDVHGSRHKRDGTVPGAAAGQAVAAAATAMPPSASIAVAAPADEELSASGGEESRPAWDGVKLLPFAASVGVGLATCYLIPVPEGLTDQAWQLLAIFLSTIAGLILGPLPVGAWAFVCLSFAVISGALSFSDAISAMTNEVIWLIVISFFFARGFVTTGLGDRIATLFVKWFGSSTLGLSYGLTASEALLAPAMPSTTARAGGVFLPIIDSLSKRFDSHPNHSSSRKLGAYLTMTQLQSSASSSAMFLTGAGQNLLCLKLAQEMGVAIPNAFATWMGMAVLPGIAGLAVTPLLMFHLFPPEIKETPEAPAEAGRRLKEMGGLSGKEMIMIATMGLAISMWIMGEPLGIPSVVTAMCALSLLLLSGVVTWSECLGERSAWDTLMWFAALITMSNHLTHLGVVAWMADSVAGGLGMVPGGIAAGDMATGGMLAEEIGGVAGLLGGDVGEMVGVAGTAVGVAAAAVGGGAAGLVSDVGAITTALVSPGQSPAELTWVSSFFQLQLLYFVSHYLFAGQTAHVGALYAAFLAMQLAAGVPGEVGAFALAINTNLFGAITHYSSGQAALYFGAGYIKLPELFKIGAISAVVNLVLWTTVCSVWWHFYGVF